MLEKYFVLCIYFYCSILVDTYGEPTYSYNIVYFEIELSDCDLIFLPCRPPL